MTGSARPALVAAAVAGLAADATLLAALGGTAKVYSNVPANTVPPYLWVLGGLERVLAKTLGEGGRRVVQLEITAVSAYRGTAEVDALLSRALALVESAPPAVTGYTATWRFNENRRPQQVETDGGVVLWLGTLVIDVLLT